MWALALTISATQKSSLHCVNKDRTIRSCLLCISSFHRGLPTLLPALFHRDCSLNTVVVVEKC